MKPKRSLMQIFSLMLTGVALVSIFLIGALWISFENNRSQIEAQKIRSDYIAVYEEFISLETNRICDYMEARRQASQTVFFEALRERVNEAHAFIKASDGGPGVNPDQARISRDLILKGIKGIQLNNGRSRFLVADFEGRDLLNPAAEPEILDNAAPGGLPTPFQEIRKTLSETNEGFFNYNLLNSVRKTEGLEYSDSPPVVFLKVFEPYRWIVGTGEYIENFNRYIQKGLLDWASSMTMPNDYYLMIIDYDGNILHHHNQDLVGYNVFSDDAQPDLQEFSAAAIHGAKSQPKNFLRYSFVNKETGQNQESIAYYRSVPSWRWVVITWVALKDLEAVMDERQAVLADNVRSQIYRILAISASMLLLIILLSKVMSSLATRSFASFFRFFEHASTSSIEINPSEQPFEEFARLAEAANKMIKQRELAKDLLRESELKFKTVFEVSPQVITICDPAGILVDANEEFKKFSTMPLPEAIGRPLADSFVMSKEQQQALLLELKKNGEVSGREFSCLMADGTPAILLGFGKLINMGANSFILAIFTDISALKKIEDEKFKLQERLLRSKKMEAMGLMAAEVAHDLNNILSGIVGYPQLLMMDPNLTEAQKASLSDITDTGQKAAAVVSDLLTIARGVAAPKVSLPINDIVSEYADSPECKKLQEVFPQIKLLVDLDPKAGNTTGSAVHLTKVIMNLTSNAFEAILPDQAEPKVEIKTVRTKMAKEPDGDHYGRIVPGDYIIMSVADNGPGISDTDIDKIFDPFYSKKEKGHSGTGLGLPIVLNTVKDHDGCIEVLTSSSGTTFNLYFRATVEKAPDDDKKIDLKEWPGKGQAVLVIDDVDIQRKLTSKMLTTLGYKPVAVASGEEAVEYLKEQNADLVILDMIMNPGMNGRETYSAIMKFKPQQKAIIASGMAETEDVAEAQAMGAGQFINKPYTVEDLAIAVYKALNDF